MRIVSVGTCEVQEDVVQMDAASFSDWDDALDFARSFVERAICDFKNISPEDSDAREALVEKNVKTETSFRKWSNDMFPMVSMTCRIDGLVASAIVEEGELR